MSFFAKVLKGTAFYVLTIAPIALTVDHAICSVAHVTGKSMTPTLNSGPISPTRGPNARGNGPNHGEVGIRIREEDSEDINEMIFVRKLMYEPARGDVVVLDSPGKPGEQAVKRIVALEGDIILYLSPLRSRSLASLSRQMEAEERERERQREEGEMEETFLRRVQGIEDAKEVMEEIQRYWQMKEEKRDREIHGGGREDYKSKEEKREREGNSSPKIDEDNLKIDNNVTIHKTNNTEIITEKTNPPEKITHQDTNTNKERDKTDKNTTTAISTDTDKGENMDKKMDKNTEKPKFSKKSVLFEDAELQVVRIPPGHCWVEGDNPIVSRDSKEYGPIPLGMVRGKVEAIIWPPSLVGPLRPYHGTTQIIHTNRRSYSDW